MAKKKDIEPVIAQPTLQEYIIARLDQPVLVKGGGFAKDPADGHTLTATEAIAMNIMQNALNGDLKAAQFIMQLEQTNRLQRKK